MKIEDRVVVEADLVCRVDEKFDRILVVQELSRICSRRLLGDPRLADPGQVLPLLAGQIEGDVRPIGIEEFAMVAGRGPRRERSAN